MALLLIGAPCAADCLAGSPKVVLLRMRAEELKGHLDAMLLAALEGGPQHGYAVIEALRRSTGGRLGGLAGLLRHGDRRAGGGTMSEPRLISSYLAGLAAELPASIVAELADGLAETLDAYLRQGLPPERAAEAAVAEFGGP